eukprot:911969_1
MKVTVTSIVVLLLSSAVVQTPRYWMVMDCLINTLFWGESVSNYLLLPTIFCVQSRFNSASVPIAETEKNSSKETRERAKRLAQELGSYHIDCNIDLLVNAMISLFATITGKTPLVFTQ